VLAASYVRLGQPEKAREAMQDLLASEHADRTIASVIQPFRRPADQESYATALRIAGMPEA
jgi:hypothetical protein